MSEPVGHGSIHQTTICQGVHFCGLAKSPGNTIFIIMVMITLLRRPPSVLLTTSAPCAHAHNMFTLPHVLLQRETKSFCIHNIVDISTKPTPLCSSSSLLLSKPNLAIAQTSLFAYIIYSSVCLHCQQYRSREE